MTRANSDACDLNHVCTIVLYLALGIFMDSFFTEKVCTDIYFISYLTCQQVLVKILTLLSVYEISCFVFSEILVFICM